MGARGDRDRSRNDGAGDLIASIGHGDFTFESVEWGNSRTTTSRWTAGQNRHRLARIGADRARRSQARPRHPRPRSRFLHRGPDQRAAHLADRNGGAHHRIDRFGTVRTVGTSRDRKSLRRGEFPSWTVSRICAFCRSDSVRRSITFAYRATTVRSWSDALVGNPMVETDHRVRTVGSSTTGIHAHPGPRSRTIMATFVPAARVDRIRESPSVAARTTSARAEGPGP